MGEKLLIGMLVISTLTGIFAGPFLWRKTTNPQKQVQNEKQMEKVTQKEEKQEERTDFSEIRVLISGQTLGKYIHKYLTITSSEPYYVNINGKIKKKKALEKTKLVFNRKKTGQTVVFSGTGKLKILSFKRAYGYPSYRGRLEVQYRKSGMTLVNQLLLEEYLYAVLPSEMPVSYGLEALKVQAVCARSFAVKQMKGEKFASYDADVDDSVSSQVYNNSEECKESIQAVIDTAGQVMTYKGKTILTYFFSTSWGHTADSSDVWIKDEASPVYLTGRLQNESEKILNLSTDEKLEQFLKSDLITYDSSFPWYRWKVTISFKDLNAGSIGQVQNVQVVKRGKSGVVKKIRITGSRGVKEIWGEYEIRSFLSPRNSKIIRKDGSIVKHVALLPSGCFLIKKQKKGIEITGGGYGHGVGMSQNGVKYMTEAGKTYEEVLKHYYPQAQLKTLWENRKE